MVDGSDDDTTTVPAVEARGLCRRFGDVVALDEVTLSIADGILFALLGPSGCGKTTLLRIIAGLDPQDAGDLRLHGVSVGDLPAHRRPVNTVFQSYALFPHLNVRDNIGFGLRMAKVPAAEQARRIEEAMALVQISPLASRAPHQLSGGQKQRVALARALVNRPKVLLLDEPLAALDLQLRQQLRIELRDLQRRTGLTFILVTHDQEEALGVSDRMAVMRAGRIEQTGPGEELYARPRNRFVAEFLGACNLLPVRWHETHGNECWMESEVGRFRLPTSQVSGMPRTGGRVLLGFRPENVELVPDTGPPQENEVRVQARGWKYIGATTEVFMDGPGFSWRASLINLAGTASNRVWEGGWRVRLRPEALMLLEDK